MSIKKILVPTDFTEVAKSALKVAAEIAGKTGAEVHLLNIIHVPVIDPYAPAETINTIREEEEKSAINELGKLALEFDKVQPKVHVKMGFAVDEILAFTEDNNIDLIIMGTTGASGLEEALLGSNASAVAKRTKVPMLSIPDEMKEFKANDIVYASDLGKNEVDVVNHLLELARVFGSHFHILHVHDESFPFEEGSPEDVFKTIAAGTDYKDITFHEVSKEDVADGINDFISASPCDILAMAVHHRGFFSKLFHSSLTKKMVNHSHIPVLTYFK